MNRNDFLKMKSKNVKDVFLMALQGDAEIELSYKDGKHTSKINGNGLTLTLLMALLIDSMYDSNAKDGGLDFLEGSSIEKKLKFLKIELDTIEELFIANMATSLTEDLMKDKSTSELAVLLAALMSQSKDKDWMEKIKKQMDDLNKKK